MSSIARLEEAVGLARAINLDVVHREIVRLREVKPGTFISQGILDNLIPVLAEKNVELLIVDNAITPIQQRNLEKKLNLKVIDRTALILEIFGERAQTKEGKLQVELAHLTYQRSRLVRSWTHLERQRGGAGFLGGPGETQIELDRRLIDEKIVRIKKIWKKSAKPDCCKEAPANGFLIRSSLWSAIPMPANLPFLTVCPQPAYLPKICCLPLWTTRCAKSSCLPAGGYSL